MWELEETQADCSIAKSQQKGEKPGAGAEVRFYAPAVTLLAGEEM